MKGFEIMSLVHIIKKTFGIQDANIIFSENHVEEVEESAADGQTVQIIRAKLVGEPSAVFEHCCDQPHVIKHGFLKNTEVLLPKSIVHLKTILRLDKQRFICKNCQRTSVVSTDLVDRSCSISNPVKQAIFEDAKMKRSEAEIGYDNDVSNTTVSRVVKDFHQEVEVQFTTLPEILCFDEFKSTGDAQGSMSFIFCDAQKSAIIDILPDRTLSYLRNYFKQFTEEARASVKRIIIDIYTPYMALIEELFPHADIIIDKFHTVQLMNRAMNKTRIQVMNQIKNKKALKNLSLEDRLAYRRLKKHWKLILKDKGKLETKVYRYYTGFHTKMTQQQVVETLLKIDDELRISYEFYQALLSAIHANDKEAFTKVLHSTEGISNFLQISKASLETYLPYILAQFDTPYTNSIIEGINNLIKVVKRCAFGYRKFENFKRRIMLIYKHNPIKLSRKNKQHAKKQPAEISSSSAHKQVA